MVEDTPQELIFDLVTQAVFGRHPLGRPVLGSADVISSVSRRSLGAFHRRRYRPDNVVVATAGSVDHDRLVELIERHVARRPAPLRPASLARGRRSWRRRSRRSSSRRSRRSSTTSASRRPGIARSDRRRFTASILDGMLGGSASSRLFQEIREKRGLAYAVYTFSSQYADTGQIGVYVGHARGEPGRVRRHRRGADRRAGRARARGRGARPRQGEPEDPHHALDGGDLEPHEPAREVAHNRQRAARLRPHPCGDRGGGGGLRGQARRGRAPPRRVLRGRDRAEPRSGCSRPSSPSARGSWSARRREGPAARRGRQGRRRRSPRASPRPGTTVTPAGRGDDWEPAGHDAAVDFTVPDAMRGNVERCLAAGVPASSARPGSAPLTSRPSTSWRGSTESRASSHPTSRSAPS